MLTPTQRARSLLAQMTLDEKLAQISAVWMHEVQERKDFSPTKAGSLLQHGIGQLTRTAGDSTLEPAAVARFNNALQSYLVNQTRLGIPAIVHEECCAGYMGLGGTMYPQMVGLASTFRPELAAQMTAEIRKQVRGVGAHQGLAPVLDVARDPRWGRTEETFGEDPTLVSHFSVAYIKGLQGDLADGVMATGKHFVGHSASQGGQNCAPSRIGVSDLWDVYLAPFQAAIRDAAIASIMNAYPELDGELVASSRRILTDLLRGTLGFDGLVVSDYEAIPMIHTYHRAAATAAEAACRALTAGIDVELPTRNYYGDPLRAALAAGEIGIEFVDTAAERILRKKAELGLFENPFVDEGRVLELFETPDQHDLARALARQSMVLLKNNGALPLNQAVKSLALIGPNADEGRNFLGDYSYAAVVDLLNVLTPPASQFEDIDWAHMAQFGVKTPSLLTALKAALPEAEIHYARGCDNLADDESGIAAAVQAAASADVVVLALGDRAGLTPPCTVGETRDSADLLLPGVQEKLAAAILATGKPVIVVLITGRPYAITGIAEQADAILEAWLPGEEGAAAIVETLLGENNPGGKLPLTFPRHVGQTPIYYNHKPSAGRSNWWVNYVSVDASPLYPFGHGLSYTSFDYSEFALARTEVAAGETLDVSIKVTNTGRVAGDEVVQLYVQDEYASLPRPVQELKGYIRLALAPGESKTVTFHLPVNQLAFYDTDLALVVESGSFKVMVGASSADIRGEGGFEVIGEKKAVIRDRVFVCPVSIATPTY